MSLGFDFMDCGCPADDPGWELHQPTCPHYLSFPCPECASEATYNEFARYCPSCEYFEEIMDWEELFVTISLLRELNGIEGPICLIPPKATRN